MFTLEIPHNSDLKILDGFSSSQLRPRRNLPLSSILEELFFFISSSVRQSGVECFWLELSAVPTISWPLLVAFFFFSSSSYQSFSVGILCYRMFKTCFVAQIYSLNVLWSLLK